MAGQDNTEQQQSRVYRLMDAEIETNDAILRQMVTTTVFIPNMNLYRDQSAASSTPAPEDN